MTRRSRGEPSNYGCLYSLDHDFTTYKGERKCKHCYFCPDSKKYRDFPPKQRRVPTRKARLILLDKMSNICAYCAIKLDRDSATVDHLLPRSKGGCDSISNYVLACEPCNSDKADMTLSEWIGVERPPFLQFV